MAKTKRSEESTEEFSIANPSVASSYVDDDLDMSRDSDSFPPPPATGRYTLVADFSQEDESKRFNEKQQEVNGKEKTILSTTLKFKVIGAADPNVEERTYMNRGKIKYISSRVFDGRSEITDLLKASGQLTSRSARPSNAEMTNLITELVMKQIPFDAKLDWEAQGQCETIFDSNGKGVYVQPKEFNTFSKWPKVRPPLIGPDGAVILDDNENEIPDTEADVVPAKSILFDYTHEATGEGEQVTLSPQIKIALFYAKK